MKKWPNQNELLAWWIWRSIEGGDDIDPPALVKILENFQLNPLHGMHESLCREFPSFLETFKGPRDK